MAVQGGDSSNGKGKDTGVRREHRLNICIAAAGVSSTWKAQGANNKGMSGASGAQIESYCIQV